MNIRLRTLPFTLLLCLTVCAGCASTPTELVEAREAYRKAYTDETRTLAPGALKDAERTLLLAEASYDEDGDSERTRALAYAAERRVEQARVEAEIHKLKKAQSQSSTTQPAEDKDEADPQPSKEAQRAAERPDEASLKQTDDEQCEAYNKAEAERRQNHTGPCPVCPCSCHEGRITCAPCTPCEPPHPTPP